MGSSHIALGTMIVAFMLLASLATRYEWMRGAIRSQLQKFTELNYPELQPEIVLDKEVRWRRGVFLGGAIGGLVTTLLASVLVTGEYENSKFFVAFFGALAGLWVGALVGLGAAARARSTDPGPAVRPNGAPLASFIGAPLIVTALALTLVPVATLARVGYLYGEYGLNPAGFTSQTGLIAGLVTSALLMTAAPVTLIVGAIVSRNRQAAATRDHLAWDDALFTRRIWSIVFSLGLLMAQNMLFTRPWDDLVPAGEQFYDEVLLSLDIQTFTTVAVFVALIVVLPFRPWLHYMSALWPDVETARRALREVERADKREARSIRREAERRAYNGLPPLPKETANAELEKYAPFGE